MITRKAQTSPEWLFSIGTIFFIFLFILGIAFEKKTEVIRTERFTVLRNECLKIAEAVMSTFLGGDGTSIQSKVSYNVSIIANNRLITVGDKDAVGCSIPINRINNANLTKGNLISKNIKDFVVVSNG